MIIIVQWFKGTKADVKLLFTIQKKAAILKQDFLSGTLTSTDHKGQSLNVYSSFQNSLLRFIFYIYIYKRQTCELYRSLDSCGSILFLTVIQWLQKYPD